MFDSPYETCVIAVIVILVGMAFWKLYQKDEELLLLENKVNLFLPSSCLHHKAEMMGDDGSYRIIVRNGHPFETVKVVCNEAQIGPLSGTNESGVLKGLAEQVVLPKQEVVFNFKSTRKDAPQMQISYTLHASLRDKTERIEGSKEIVRMYRVA